MLIARHARPDRQLALMPDIFPDQMAPSCEILPMVCVTS
jgi:hypothetical protein